MPAVRHEGHRAGGANGRRPAKPASGIPAKSCHRARAAADAAQERPSGRPDRHDGDGRHRVLPVDLLPGHVDAVARVGDQLPVAARLVRSTSATTQPTDYLNDPTFIVVTIDEDDIVWVEEEEIYSDQNLRSKLRAVRKEDPERTGLLVIGNPDATHGTLVGVLDAGADAGIKELLFSVDGSARANPAADSIRPTN